MRLGGLLALVAVLACGPDDSRGGDVPLVPREPPGEPVAGIPVNDLARVCNSDPLLAERPGGGLLIDGECAPLTLRALRQLDVWDIAEIDRLVILGGDYEAGGLDRLEEVGYLQVNSLNVTRSLSFPSLRVVRGQLIIAGNPHLSRLDIPALERVGGTTTVENNEALPRCHIDEVFAEVELAETELGPNCASCVCLEIDVSGE